MVMKEVKSPSQKRPVKLPPQHSASDTSNWEDRNVSAPTLDKITKKRVVRDVEFIRNEDRSEDIIAMPEQRSKEQNRTKKTSK